MGIKILWLPVLIMLFAASSCSYIIRNNNEGVWFYTYTYSNATDASKLTPASFVSLQPDHHFTLSFKNFESGNWDTKGDTLILHAVSKNFYYLLHHVSNSDLRIDLEPGLSCDFEKQPYSFSANDPQPFSLQNNRWRVRASHEENETEITQRLINHCEFWKVYFTWAFNNSMQTIDVRSTPTPIKIYGNGIGIKDVADLPVEWKNCFYDSANYRQANKILEDVVRQHDIAWAHTDNKYKMFIGAFEQMISFLQEEQRKK